MAKSNKQINKEAGMTTDDSSPAVVAYRMGQLEIAVRDGFKSHDEKLTQLTGSFASKEELNEIKRSLDNWRWYFRALVVAVFTALGTAIGALVVKR